MAVVGLTSRVDAVDLLEKRVRSRFSGRQVRAQSVAGHGSGCKGMYQEERGAPLLWTARAGGPI
eukprot:scaffold34136_cov67-Isochrysis_galbana.AAC.1